MENQSGNKPKISWTGSEKAELTKCLAVVCEGQKAYGKEVNLQSILDYFVMKFEGRHTVKEVIYAIGKYTDIKNDIPTPADILIILNPKPPEITQTEYIAAGKWQEQNGFPIFSAALDIIEAYEKQQRLARESYREELNIITNLGPNAFGTKKIDYSKPVVKHD
jgi:hypothetical protein